MPKLKTAEKKSPAKKGTVAKKPIIVKTDGEERMSGELVVSETKPIGTVYVEKGVTKNMGDFNSARVTVGVTLNINPTKAEIAEAKATITVVTEMLDTELERQVSELLT